MRELRGVLHIHTRYSDGTGTVPEIAGAARECGLDFIGINDHMSLGARDDGHGGMHQGVLVLAGVELNDRRGANHILAYGIDDIPPSRDTAGQLAAVREAGGLAIAAHPFERRGYLPKTRAIGWSGPLDGLDGAEVWNYMSIWKAGITLLDIRARLDRPDDYTRCTWDESRDFWFGCGGCAVGGADAHAYGLGPARAFPYPMLFRRVLTHVLLDRACACGDDPTERTILEAIRSGRCFASNALLGDAGGFRAVRRGSSVEVTMPGEAQLVAATPSGTVFSSTAEGVVAFAAPVGQPVALEASRDGRTWIWCGLSCSVR